MKKIDPEDYRAPHGKKINLNKWPTRVDPTYESKKEYEQLLQQHTQELSDQQSILYGANRYALLIVFQAMDAAGKDSSIKHVMSGVNPQGCEVYSFKHPSSEELSHDFLWKAAFRFPERGRIGIFNRSYYEEVLILRVHPTLLRNENLPDEILREKDLWKDRFRSIVDMERHLYHNGTRIIKFFLHLSKEEQRKRFLKRIETPEKNWKFSMADVEERKYWRQYMSAYEDCLSATSTAHAPWYIVPADDKLSMQLIVSRIIVSALEGLKLSYPEPDASRRRELKEIRKKLEKN